MATPKQTLDQYNQVGSELKQKLHPLFDEKNKKRAAIKELFGDNPEDLKQHSASMRAKLNQKWRTENAELLETYKALYDQKKTDDENFLLRL
ncbi:MAG: hypothetical protein WCO66_00995 [Candidatus Absconditabacteria bacterium]